jgi:hypothetical protein
LAWTRADCSAAVKAASRGVTDRCREEGTGAEEDDEEAGEESAAPSVWGGEAVDEEEGVTARSPRESTKGCAGGVKRKESTRGEGGEEEEEADGSAGAEGGAKRTGKRGRRRW